LKVTNSDAAQVFRVTTDGRTVLGGDTGQNSVLSIKTDAGINDTKSALIIVGDNGNMTVNEHTISTTSPNFDFGANNSGSAINMDTPNNFALNIDGSDVGINQQNPTARLDVNGTMRVRDIPSGSPTIIIGADANGNFLEYDASGLGDGYMSGEAAGGDLSGTFPSPTVDGIQGDPVSATNPSSGQALVWNGSSYLPTDIATQEELNSAASGDNLGNHQLTQTLQTGLFAVARSSSSNGSILLTDEAFLWRNSLNSESILLQDAAVSLTPRTDDPTLVAQSSFFFKEYTDDGQEKTGLFIRKEGDRSIGGNASTETVRLLEEGESSSSTTLATSILSADVQTTTADPVVTLSGLQISNVDAGTYEARLVAYVTRASSSSSVRADWEFTVSGSYDTADSHIGEGGGPSGAYGWNQTLTGTQLPGTATKYCIELVGVIEVTANGLSITPRFEP